MGGGASGLLLGHSSSTGRVLVSLSNMYRKTWQEGGGGRTPEHACGHRMTRRCQQGINSSVSDPYSFYPDPDPAF